MTSSLESTVRRRRWLLALGVLVLAGLSWAAVRGVNRRPQVPTAEVKRSEFVDYLELRGQVKAIHSVVVTAPADAEDLQILHLVHEGARVKKGDVLVEFDATKLKATLAQDRSVLRGAEAGTEQTRATSRITLEGDRTDLLKAGYDVDSAKLDASKGEIVSRIEGAEDQLVVADNQSKLAASAQKSKSDKTGADADLDGQKHKSDKAAFDVKLSEHRISVLTLRAPLDGIVTILTNYRSGGFMGGDQPFKEGDQAWPGAGIVEIPDLSALRIECRIEESDRARVALNQAANVRVDALPDRELSGHVARIGALATVDFSGGWPFPKNFELGVGLDQSDPRLRPGMNATARIAVDKIPNAIVIPAEAAFQKSGETVAYVLHGSKFDERTIEVGKRGESQLVITAGLKPGDRVALKDPTQKQ
ncbi:MAG TPA: efflux RND transporter periplasmic adaptor subunit [Terriglobia bacterium]|nr:efflux RND transporter periplasmic adaptor subunit [Terriglobia bacterium]